LDAFEIPLWAGEKIRPAQILLQETVGEQEITFKLSCCWFGSLIQPNSDPEWNILDNHLGVGKYFQQKEDLPVKVSKRPYWGGWWRRNHYEFTYRSLKEKSGAKRPLKIKWTSRGAQGRRYDINKRVGDLDATEKEYDQFRGGTEAVW
jgi:hypothetical protein